MGVCDVFGLFPFLASGIGSLVVLTFLMDLVLIDQPELAGDTIAFLTKEKRG